MFSSLFKLCTKHAVYLMVWAFSHCNIIYVPRWAYMTFDPPFREWYHPSAILLSATLSQRVISALYDLSDVDFDLPVEGIDLDELWPSFVLWVDPSLASHTLCREDRSGYAATIKLACCDIIVLNDNECDLQGARIWLVTSSFYCGVVTTRWLQRDQTLPLCEGVIPTRCIVHLHV